MILFRHLVLLFAFTVKVYLMHCGIKMLQRLGLWNMSYRFMRILVMFDLPTSTSVDRKEYRNFRKYLIVSGFLMLQESVYSKLVLNTTSANIIMDHVRKNKPPSGSLFMLTVTEKQFSRMEIVVGDKQSEVIDSTERVLMI